MIVLPFAWGALILTGAWSVRPNALRLAREHDRADVQRLVPPAVTVTAFVLPLPVAVVIVLLACAAPMLAARRAARARALEVLRTLPEVVDLVLLAVGAGLTVPMAVEAVARRARGPIADELRTALDEVALGRRLGDALADVPSRTGEVVRPLLDALVASDRYGAPLSDALARLAAEVRADRRRRAEEAARKVPVKLLFPLVCCVLPAFGLLTLAPLIAGAVAALRL